jgi:hypothetical protein
MSKIAEVLRESPPLRPSSAAVDLLLAVSRLQVCTLIANMHRQLFKSLASARSHRVAPRRGNMHQCLSHCTAVAYHLTPIRHDAPMRRTI